MTWSYLDVVLTLSRLSYTRGPTLALAAFALVIWVGVLPWQAQNRASENARAGRMAKQVATPRSPSPRPEPAPLPTDEEVSSTLHGLFTRPPAADFRIPAVSYQTDEAPQGGLRKLHVRFTAYASYPALREFLSKTTDSQPLMTIDELMMEREDGTAQVKARIHLSWPLAPRVSSLAQSSPDKLHATPDRLLTAVAHSADPKHSTNVFAALEGSLVLPAGMADLSRTLPPPQRVTSESVAQVTPALPPWRWIGQQESHGVWSVFVVLADEVRVLHEQDDVNHIYRIERIAPPALEVTHLPTGTRLVMSIGEVAP